LLTASPSTESVSQQTAGICAPCKLGVAELRQVGGCSEERGPPVRGVEVASELEHCRVVERRLPLHVAAGGEDEQGSPHGSVALVLLERDLLPRDECGDDEVDV